MEEETMGVKQLVKRMKKKKIWRKWKIGTHRRTKEEQEGKEEE